MKTFNLNHIHILKSNFVNNANATTEFQKTNC